MQLFGVEMVENWPGTRWHCFQPATDPPREPTGRRRDPSGNAPTWRRRTASTSTCLLGQVVT